MDCPGLVINHPKLSFSSFNESMALANAAHSLVFCSLLLPTSQGPGILPGLWSSSVGLSLLTSSMLAGSAGPVCLASTLHPPPVLA